MAIFAQKIPTFIVLPPARQLQCVNPAFIKQLLFPSTCSHAIRDEGIDPCGGYGDIHLDTAAAGVIRSSGRYRQMEYKRPGIGNKTTIDQ